MIILYYNNCKQLNTIYHKRFLFFLTSCKSIQCKSIQDGQCYIYQVNISLKKLQLTSTELCIDRYYNDYVYNITIE